LNHKKKRRLIMRTSPTLLLSTILLTAFAAVLFLLPGAMATEDERLEPTRTLNDVKVGRLTVLSEPPGFHVSLNGVRIGKTPVWNEEVDPGVYTLTVRDEETDIMIRSGETFRISLFKDTFIVIPEEERPDVAPPPPFPREAMPDQRILERRRELERKEPAQWDLFINRTLRHF
jgi:hypothetical protein